MARPLITELARMFVHEGQRGTFISDNLGTNATQTSLSKLLQLKSKGWIEYKDNELGSRIFGVKMWDCKLTQAEKKHLRPENEMDAHAFSC